MSEKGADRPWWSVRPGAVVRGVVWGAVLLAAGIALWPWAEKGFRTARLMAADPPPRLPVPVDGVEPGELRNTWGAPRGGGERRHRGIDIFASRRTPVRSATPGILVRRGENPLGGRTVTILGPGGQRHYYAHLQQYGGQSEGEWVEVGEVIGFVGSSGNAPANAPHLHYTIYASGGAINPYPRLTGADTTAAGDAPR